MRFLSVTNLHVKKYEEEKARDESDLSFNSGSASKSALEQVVARFLVVHYVLEFGLHQLAVVVRDQIFERIFKALETFALVAAVFKATTENRDALKIDLI